jgi:hypothetical protein
MFRIVLKQKHKEMVEKERKVKPGSFISKGQGEG